MLEDVVVVAQLAEHHLAVGALVGRAEHGAGGRADVRQAGAFLRGHAHAGDGKHQGNDGGKWAHGVSCRGDVSMKRDGDSLQDGERRVERSEESRVGKGGGSTCRSRWAPYYEQKREKEKN